MKAISLSEFGLKWTPIIYGIEPGQRGFAKAAITTIAIVTGNTETYSRSLYYGQLDTPEYAGRLLALANVVLEHLHASAVLNEETFTKVFTLS